ncbi:hypothetical protein MTO96_002527 [Rhipicephalus appendiculatus]
MLQDNAVPRPSSRRGARRGGRRSTAASPYLCQTRMPRLSCRYMASRSPSPSSCSLRNLEKLDPDDSACRLAWELLERLSQQLSSGPVLPLYNAMGPKLTPAPPKLAAMERLDNGCSRHRGGSEGDSEVFTNRSPSPPKNRLNFFKFITQGWRKSPTHGDRDAHVSGLSRSSSCRSKSTQSRRSSQTSPVLRRNQEVVGVQRSPNSTRVTKRSVEASPPRSPPQHSSPRSTQLTRSSVLRSSTDGQPPVVAAACKTSPEIRRRPDVKDSGRPPAPSAPSEPQGLKGVQSANGGKATRMSHDISE